VALGPGKYGKNAEALLKVVGGDLCIVILSGPDGLGFDVATSNLALLATIPGILRIVADSLDRDLFEKGGGPLF
jgi:hypothetical protein